MSVLRSYKVVVNFLKRALTARYELHRSGRINALIRTANTFLLCDALSNLSREFAAADPSMLSWRVLIAESFWME